MHKVLAGCLMAGAMVLGMQLGTAPARAEAGPATPAMAAHAPDRLVQAVQYYGPPGHYGGPRYYGRPRFYGPGPSYYGSRRFYGGPRYNGPGPGFYGRGPGPYGRRGYYR